MGNWQWIRGGIDSDLSGPFLLDKALEVESSGAGSVVVTVPFNGSGSLVWYSPIGQPESTSWPVGSATANLRITTGNSNVMITDVSIQRLAEDGTFVDTYGSLTGSILATAGTKNFTIPVVAQASPAPTDRLRIGFTLVHNGAGGSTDVGIGYGDPTNGLLTVPIPKVIKRYKAGSIGDADEITAAPSSLAMSAAPTSLGISATVVAMNPPSAESTSAGLSGEPS